MCYVVRCSFIRHNFTTCFGINVHHQVYRVLHFKILLSLWRKKLEEEREWTREDNKTSNAVILHSCVRVHTMANCFLMILICNSYYCNGEEHNTGNGFQIRGRKRSFTCKLNSLLQVSAPRELIAFLLPTKNIRDEESNFQEQNRREIWSCSGHRSKWTAEVSTETDKHIEYVCPWLVLWRCIDLLILTLFKTVLRLYCDV
jgi:hypothetical protein